MAKKFRELIKGMSPERILKVEAEVKSMLLEIEKFSNRLYTEYEKIEQMPSFGIDSWVRIKREAWEREFPNMPYEGNGDLPKQVDYMPSHPPFDGYCMLAYPFVWWKYDELDPVNNNVSELIPNSTTLEAMAELEAGKGKSFADIPALMVDLLSEDDTKIDLEIDRPLESCMFCDHANENPQYCYCNDNCYCKSHTCRKI